MPRRSAVTRIRYSMSQRHCRSGWFSTVWSVALGSPVMVLISSARPRLMQLPVVSHTGPSSRVSSRATVGSQRFGHVCWPGMYVGSGSPKTVTSTQSVPRVAPHMRQARSVMGLHTTRFVLGFLVTWPRSWFLSAVALDPLVFGCGCAGFVLAGLFASAVCHCGLLRV